MLTTFGSLCDLIVSKIILDRAENCYAQHAFYKIRMLLSPLSQG